MMNRQSLIPFRPAAITHVTRGQSFSRATSHFNEMQRAITSACAVATAFSPLGDVFRQSLNLAMAFEGLWMVILACMIKPGDLMRQMSSMWLEMEASISEWWASTSDDSPLFDDDYDFDDEIIGMEIRFVAFADADTGLWSDDETSDEYEQ